MEIIIELLKQRTTLVALFVKMSEIKCYSCAELALKALNDFDANYKDLIQTKENYELEKN